MSHVHAEAVRSTSIAAEDKKSLYRLDKSVYNADNIVNAQKRQVECRTQAERDAPEMFREL